MFKNANPLLIKDQTYNIELFFDENSSKVYIIWMVNPSIYSNQNNMQTEQQKNMQSQFKDPLIEKPCRESKQKIIGV
jgi:hypothetical protein